MKKLHSKLLVAEHSSGRMIDIGEARNGLDCDCICSCCKERLVARQGESNDWSFAHESGANCAGALESALHKAAKQIIEDERKLYVGAYDAIENVAPNFYRWLAYANSKYGTPSNTQLVNKISNLYHYANRELVDKVISTQVLCNTPILIFSDVVSEKGAEGSSKVPDLTCIYNGQPYYVEIFVTNKCDNEKILKLTQLNVPTIEVDLSALKRINFTMADLRNVLIENGTSFSHLNLQIRRNWIVKPKHFKDADQYATECVNAAKENKEQAKGQNFDITRIPLEVLGTKIIINQSGLDIAISLLVNVSAEADAHISRILDGFKAKRIENDWLIQNAKPNCKMALIQAFNSVDKANRIAEERAYQTFIAKRKVAEFADGEDAVAQVLLKNEAIQEEKDAQEAKRELVVQEVTDKHKGIADRRWRTKKINEDLIALGFEPIF
jgi:hypothetical protein